MPVQPLLGESRPIKNISQFGPSQAGVEDEKLALSGLAAVRLLFPIKE